MWSRLDDKFPRHPKVQQAGRDLGENGRALAMSLFIEALCWSNEFLTDGYLPDAAIDGFSSVRNPDGIQTDSSRTPQEVAEALCRAGMFERNEHGYHIHDFDHYNPSAASIKEKRRNDVLRKSQQKHSSAKTPAQTPRGIRVES